MKCENELKLIWGKEGGQKIYIAEETSLDTRTSAEHDAIFYPNRKEINFFLINDYNENVCWYELHYGMDRFDIGAVLFKRLFPFFLLSLFFFSPYISILLRTALDFHIENVFLFANGLIW